jgi:hypothetical protein
MATQIKKDGEKTTVKTSKKKETVEVKNESIIKPIQQETAKVYVSEETENLQKENNKLKETILKQQDDFSAKFNQMQAQLDTLLKIVGSTTKQTKVEDSEEDIAIGCRVFAGLSMSTPDGMQNITFRCGEQKFISLEDLVIYLKESKRNNKSLFANGLLYFYDEKYYDKFKIKKLVDLSEENILKILLIEDKNEMIRKVSELTNGLKKKFVTHTFKFIIADMLVRNPLKLKFWNYDSRIELENYIGVKFDTLIANAGMYRSIKS